jgi:hypothetical protein
MKSATGKGSTTELDRREISECMGALLRGVDQNLGVFVSGLEGELDG